MWAHFGSLGRQSGGLGEPCGRIWGAAEGMFEVKLLKINRDLHPEWRAGFPSMDAFQRSFESHSGSFAETFGLIL